MQRSITFQLLFTLAMMTHLLHTAVPKVNTECISLQYLLWLLVWPRQSSFRYDLTISNIETQLTQTWFLQNTTFGGIQGFSRKPSTPWTDDAGNFAGIVHQERNWTYVLFAGAGHTVPFSKPAAVRFSFLPQLSKKSFWSA
jgi:hypothetical protein